MNTSIYSSTYLRLKEINKTVVSLGIDDILNTNDRDLLNIFKELDKIVAQDIDKNSIAWMYTQKDFKEIVYNISRFRRWYGLKLEIDKAKELIRDKDPWHRIKNFVFYENYVNLSIMERDAANLKSGSQVVFIGSGPLPMSLIMFAHIHKVKSIGIEKQEEYVNISKELVVKLGLQNMIQIIHGDHRCISDIIRYGPCSVMVASAAYPKQEIFDFLSIHLKRGTEVIYRTYEKGLRQVFCDFEFDLPPSLIEIKRIHPRPPVNNSVVVLKKI